MKRLPRELLDRVLEQLNVPALVCLKLTSKDLFGATVVEKDRLMPCARWVITTRLESDLIAKAAALPGALSMRPLRENPPLDVLWDAAYEF